MSWGAYDNDPPPLLLGLAHQLVDPGDIWAGGVYDPNAPFLQNVMDGFSLPVGAKDDHASLSGLLWMLDHHGPQ